LIVVDQALPYYQLIVYKFKDCADDPSFKKVKNPLSNNSGIMISFTVQCPFAVVILDNLKKIAEKRDILFHAYQLKT